MNVSQESVRNYITTRLGAPTIQVELDNTHLDGAIQDALDLFNQYVIDTAWGRDDTGGTSVVIEMPAEAVGVLYVTTMLPENEITDLNWNIFEIVPRMVWPRLAMSDYALLKMYYDMYLRARGTDPDWRYLKEERKLYVDCRSGPYTIAYTYATLLTLNSFNTSYITYQTKFLKACRGYAEQVLGRIRGKFGNVPAPSGALVTDAVELKQEGAALIVEVEDALKRITPPVAAIWG